MALPIQHVQMKDTIIDNILTLLKAEQQYSFFNAFFYGVPGHINSDLLPAISAKLLRTQIYKDISEYTLRSHIELKITYDCQADFGQYTNSEVPAERILQQFVEGIDPVTNKYEIHTVSYILFNNFLVSNGYTAFLFDTRYYGSTTKSTEAFCEITFIVDKTITLP